MDGFVWGIKEVTDIDFEELRIQTQTQECSGLGPPDLIVIDKIVNKKKKRYFHYSYGIPHTGKDDFGCYYQAYTKYHQSFTTTKGKPEKGRCYSWDCFLKQDVCIPNTDASPYPTPNWNNLHISSVLRYYRHSDGLLPYIFEGRKGPYTATTYSPLYEISMDELNYAAEIFSCFENTEEEQMAIARALIVNFNVRQITKFCHKFQNRLPRVLTNIVAQLPPNTVVEPGLFFLIESHLDMYSDDVDSAFALVNHLISVGEVQKALRYVPLLMTGLGRDPNFGICLGRLSAARGDFESSFSFLNDAAVCSGFDISSHQNSKFSIPSFNPLIVAGGRTLPNAAMGLELSIVRRPLSGTFEALFEAIVELRTAMGNDIFRVKVEELTNEADAEAEIKSARVSEKEFKSQLPGYTDCYRTPGEVFLFDPGVEEEPHARQLLRASPAFAGFLKAVESAAERLRDLELAERQRGRITYREEDLLAALRMRHGPILSAAAAQLLEGRAIPKPLCELLLMKGALLGICGLPTEGPLLDEASDALRPGSASQVIALSFARWYVPRVLSLERIQ